MEEREEGKIGESSLDEKIKKVERISRRIAWVFMVIAVVAFFVNFIYDTEIDHVGGAISIKKKGRLYHHFGLIPFSKGRQEDLHVEDLEDGYYLASGTQTQKITKEQYYTIFIFEAVFVGCAGCIVIICLANSFIKRRLRKSWKDSKDG
jgi:hypothetical protein